MDEKDTAQQPAASSPEQQAPATTDAGATAPTPAATPTPETSAPAPQATEAPAGAPVQQSAVQPTATMANEPVSASGQVPPTPPVQQPVYATPAPEAPIAAPGQAQPSPTGALVCGILAIVFCFIPIVGIVLGVVAIVLAGKYFKAGGTLGQGKAGRICGIVGIALSIIMMIVSAIMTFASIAFVNEYANTRSSDSYSYSSSAYTQSSSIDTTEEEQAVEDVVAARLQQIEDRDPAALAEIQTEMESTFEEAMASAFGGEGMTMASCGMDPAQIVDSMLEGFTYEAAYMMVDGTEEGDTAEANFYVTMRDMYEILDDINDVISARATELRSLDEAQLQIELGKIVTAAIDEADPDEEQLFDVDLTYEDGAWVIDDETWESEINFFFGFI